MYKDNQRAKAWESTVRKTQQQQRQQPGRRRGLVFQSMPVSPADESSDSVSLSSSSSSSSAASSPTPSFEDPDDNDQHQHQHQHQHHHSLIHAEKLLPNGDFYTGQWHHQLPHGTGKYLWTDGCMYEGEWRHGKTMGRGKFSWPSGASYEGDFKSGFMDGGGTYIGINGDTYKGGWSMNLKHGSGKKSYANGDCYDGDWRSGMHDGHGRYIWKNGNEYVGQWRSGVIHGRGSLIWANGNRYDGGWENGVPMGNGSFRWADGSLYIGIWSSSNDAEEKKGIYYPSPAASSRTARDPQAIFDRELPDCKICPGETVTILPSQKRLNLSGMEIEALQQGRKGPDAPRPRRRGSVDTGAGVRWPNGRVHAHTVIGGMNNGSNGGAEKGFERMCIWESDGDITCDIVDGGGMMMNGGRPLTDSVGRGEDEPRLSRSSQGMPIRLPKTTKKQGETISKGHKNYDLMLNLQLGIRHAVGRHAGQVPTFDLKSSAFDPKEKVWTKFPPEGSKYTPPHQSSDFKWKDYCPLVFRTLRRLFKVDAADYMLSICGNDALRELSSPGKSGSFFYLTNDDRYMIKTIKKAEVKVLLRMLPAYYKHVLSYEHTLMTKFFGLHCVKLTGPAQKKVRFVIMGNLFCSEYVIHRRFDLKGSSHGRITDKPESEIDENTTLKDLDLHYIFRLHKAWFQEFCRQVDRDCDLLEQERIMDYSLLVGVHFRESRDTTQTEVIIEADYSKETAPRLSRADMDQLLVDPTRWSTLRLGINMPARVEQTVRRNEGELIGEPTGEAYEVVLFFGIIDILQDYDISKKLEHAYKSIQYDATSISAVDPKQYSKRFKDFVFKAFTEDT